ncbi:proline-rich protein PRCC isoform X2 [Bufo bufo]|uniref:proline-rich protein PRCC isoform X2 n=1 Tax=Bufo bufo TaxID=8384 RepID=UPI001ABE81FC|nr:proline-rich protein PRCC isoform X2 [Bufo bufo]
MSLVAYASSEESESESEMAPESSGGLLSSLPSARKDGPPAQAEASGYPAAYARQSPGEQEQHSPGFYGPPGVYGLGYPPGYGPPPPNYGYPSSPGYAGYSQGPTGFYSPQGHNHTSFPPPGMNLPPPQGGHGMALPPPHGGPGLSLPPPHGGPGMNLPPPQGGPNMNLPPPPGGPNMNVPPPHGGPNMNLPPPQGGPNMNLPPPQGGPNMNLPPPQGGPNMNLPPPQGGPNMNLPPPSHSSPGLNLPLPQGASGLRLPPPQNAHGMSLPPPQNNSGLSLPPPQGGLGMTLPPPPSGNGLSLPPPMGGPPFPPQVSGGLALPPPVSSPGLNIPPPQQSSSSSMTLPPPKASGQGMSLPPPENDNSKPKKRSEPVKISVPELSAGDSDSDEDKPSKKRAIIQSSKEGFGLSSLLPQPKNEAKRQLLPYSFTKKASDAASEAKLPKMPLVSKPKLTPSPEVSHTPSPSAIKAAAKNAALQVTKQITQEEEEEDDGDEDFQQGNFFSLSESSEVPPSPAESFSYPLPAPDDDGPPGVDPAELQNDTANAPLEFKTAAAQASNQWSAMPGEDYTAQQYEQYPEGAYFPEYYGSGYYQEQEPPSTQRDSDASSSFMDDEAFKRLQGKRNRGREEINFVEIKGDDQLSGNQQWLTKALTEEKNMKSFSKKKGEQPTGQQRRKHQITYLIHQAKERELELKNAWSENKMSRRQTQAKYGF